MANSTKVLTTAQYQALQTGLLVYCANTVFEIAGQSYTTPQAVALIASILNANVAVAPAKAALKEAIASRDKTEAQDGTIVRGVREVVALTFENAPTTLAALAIEPRKARTPLSTAARAAANAKREATRKARGITSKKQKALVTGNVTGVSITPITSSASTGGETAPAATAPATPATTTAPAASLPTTAVVGTPHA